MSYQRPRKCPICGNQMSVQLTNAPDISFICTHPHTAAMVDEFIARTSPNPGTEGDNNEGTKGSNNDG